MDIAIQAITLSYDRGLALVDAETAETAEQAGSTQVGTTIGQRAQA